MHFCMLVIGENWEEQLAPYDSNIEVEPYIDEAGDECTYNPQGKWDWYTVGGRYNEMLLLKSGTSGYKNPQISWTQEGEEPREGWVDQAKKKDIDWEGMLQEQRQYLEKKWYEYGEREDPRITNLLREGTQTAEEYITKNMYFCTYGYLKDGIWFDRYQKEESHYSCTEEEQQQAWKEWNKDFRDMLVNLPDDTLLTIIDCHN